MKYHSKIITAINLKDVPVAILAGGLATRMRPVSEKIPKSLFSIAGNTFIVHQLELLHRQGISRAVLCLGYLGEKVQQELKNRKDLKIKLDYSFDGSTLLGTGGAVKKAIPKLDDIFFVIYGDSYLHAPMVPILDYFLRSGKNGLMTVIRNNQYDRSNVIFKDNTIVAYDKTRTLPEMQHVDYGLSLFRSSVFETWPEETAFDMAYVIDKLIKTNDLAGFEVKERPYEIGSSKGLLDFENFIKQNDINK